MVDNRLQEQAQKLEQKQATINGMVRAVDILMKTFEEMIILTDRWEDQVHPYLIRDQTLMNRKDREVKAINKMLKDAKRAFRRLQAGERIPDGTGGDAGEGGQ